jgi:two-component system, OmpR family, sensor histidine kinase KdpD
MIPIETMPSHLSTGKALRWLTVTVSVAAATLLLELLHANSTMAGMAYLVLVVLTATQAGIGLSLYMAALCTVTFEFFFLPPYRTFSLAGTEQWMAMLAFVASCLIVSRVAERARRQTEKARQRQADVERLYAMSQEMMLRGAPEELIRDLPRLIGSIFGLSQVVLLVCDRDCAYVSAGEIPKCVEAGLRTIANGEQLSVALTDDFAGAPLMVGLRRVGALAWSPAALSREMAAAISAQVAIMLERAIAVEASARMEAAREADRLRNALIDSLTHELRTPLTSIRAASTTLLDGADLDEAVRADLVKVIDEESSRLDELIGQSVEMAEIDANMLEVKLAPHHLRAFIEEIIEQSRKNLDSHPVAVVIDDPEKLAWFDAHLVGRVFRHLLENAASHTPAGTRIKVSSRSFRSKLEFTVEDEGAGIDARDLPMIFDKFYRGKRGAEVRKGSGMGLAIARAIVHAHGGDIEVVSEPGAGACFRFWVPFVSEEPETARRQAPEVKLP